MIWNDHKKLEGLHAFLGASTYSWLKYDADRLVQVYMNRLATLRGTETHEYAALCIKRRQKLPKSKLTLNRYVNDAIGFGMSPEKVLFYSENCFGTADAISFEKNFLRIHDLKTGVIPAKMDQLMIYAGIFCLEYNVKPVKLSGCELRIYQSDDVMVYNPTPEEIQEIMDKIMFADKVINDVKKNQEEM